MKQTEMAKETGGVGRLSDANGGESKVAVPNPEQDNTSNEELLTSVEERLADVTEEPTPKRNPAADYEDNDDPTLDESDSDENEREADESDEGEEAEASDVDGSPNLEGNEDGTIPLPEAYVRCAMAYGWKTREDVLKFYNQDPAMAVSTLSNLYAARNKASGEFAAIGRQHAEEKKTQQSTDSDAVKVPTIDVESLKQQFGEEAGPLISLIESQNAVIKKLNSKDGVTEPLRGKTIPGRGKASVEETMIEQQLDTFFESDNMKPYEKVYGKLEIGQTWDDLSPGQRMHRWKVMEQADQIAGGANQLQGRDVSLAEALERAHLIVTHKYRDKIVVDGIKAKVIKRQKGLTLDPAKSRRKSNAMQNDTGVTGKRTKSQIEAAVAQRMRKAFG